MAPGTPPGWPDVVEFVDPTWDREERKFVVAYLRHGVLGRLYMGHSTCRLCGRTNNGYAEHSDGTFIWPSGLAHYVADHEVRLPSEFVTHAYAMTERLEGPRDDGWWKAAPRD